MKEPITHRAKITMDVSLCGQRCKLVAMLIYTHDPESCDSTEEFRFVSITGEDGQTIHPSSLPAHERQSLIRTVKYQHLYEIPAT